MKSSAMTMRMDAAETMFRVQMPAFDPESTRAWMRLIKAAVLSFLLHFALLVGIPVNPTGGVPQMVSTITARLEPASADPEPMTESVAVVPEAPPAPSADKPRKAPDVTTESKPEPVRAIEQPASSPASGIEVPFIRDPTYYPAKQLDVYPQPLGQIRLDYPESAASAKVDGRLLVLLLIDEFGVVNDASVVESQPEGYFEDAALAVFRAARFSPAQKQGRAVKSRVLLQVKYLYGQSAGALR
ncbi:MAG: TonB family protein [Betaproteobacteria bacterium]